MPIAMIVLIVAAVAAVIFSSEVRRLVLDALTGIRDYVVGAMPTGAQIGTAIRPVIWTIVIFVGLGVLAALLFSGIILILGIRGDAFWSSLLIAILFPAWCFMYIAKPFLRRLIVIPYRITSVILILALPFFDQPPLEVTPRYPLVCP